MVIACVLYVIMGSACTPLVMGGTRAGGRARGVYPRVYPPLWIVFSKKEEVYFSRPLAARRARGRSPTRARLNTRRGFFFTSRRRAARDWDWRARARASIARDERRTSTRRARRGEAWRRARSRTCSSPAAPRSRARRRRRTARRSRTRSARASRARRRTRRRARGGRSGGRR